MACFFMSVSPSRAQGLLTAGAVIAGAQGVISQLQNLAPAFGGAAQNATDNAAGRMSDLIMQLRAAAHDNINVPLTALTSQAQDTARELQSLTVRANSLLTQQQAHLYANLTVFVSGIENVALEAGSFVPFIHAAQPRLQYFKFDAETFASVVPQDGGPLTLYGYRLWDDAPPRISLYNQARDTVLASPVPQRSTGPNNISISLDPSFITGNAGKVIFVRVDRFVYRRDVFGRHRGTPQVSGDAMYLPIAVPQVYSMAFKVVGHIAYGTSATDQIDLPAKPLHFENHACEHDDHGSATLKWTYSLANSPDTLTEWHIVSVRDVNMDSVNNAHPQLNITAPDTVQAECHLDSATCVSVGLLGIHHFVHDTHYTANVIVTIARTVQGQATSDQASPVTPLITPTTLVNTSLPKAASAVPNSDVFWFEVIPVINGVDGPQLYASPHINGVTAPSFSRNGVLISGSYTPAVVSGNAQISVNFTAQ